MTELLTTKLFIPRPRSNLVSRPRLTELLNAGLDRKLTLIAAPAGFGKTTLLSEWVPQSPRCVTWLSLDEGDNAPARFWVHFVDSLQMLSPEIGVGAQALLQSRKLRQSHAGNQGIGRSGIHAPVGRRRPLYLFGAGFRLTR